MKHTIRQHGQITQIDCDLVTKLKTKGGKPIAEGDIVRPAKRSDHFLENEKESTWRVQLAEEPFVLVNTQTGFVDGRLRKGYDRELVVVGHVEG